MIKKIPLTLAVEKVVALKMLAIDKIVESLVEPLEDVGNPEKLIGKKFSDWSENDLQLLVRIYGSGEKTPLTNTIFNRTYERVKELERAEL